MKRVMVVLVCLLLIIMVHPTTVSAATDPGGEPGAMAEPPEERVVPDRGNATETKDPKIGQVTPLHRAVRSGQLDQVRDLLAQGAQVNAAIAKRSVLWHRLETPLETAIRNRQVEIAKLLIERGANVNARNPRGETLLHLAVRNNDLEFVRILLAAGAHPTVASNDRLTPAHLAQKLDGRSAKRKEIRALLKQAEAKALQEEPPTVPVAPPSAPPE